MKELGAGLAMLVNRARQSKHLRHAGPSSSQEVIEFGTHDEFADLQTPMAFVDGARGAPVPAIDRRLAEEELQVILQDGLVAFGDEDIVPVPAVDAPTEAMRGIQGIAPYDPSFNQQRRQELRHDAQFILLLSRHL